MNQTRNQNLTSVIMFHLVLIAENDSLKTRIEFKLNSIDES